uniref:Uncharacterized protein n=1 Tax=Tanacetum cinerariifolium TaxID=118510 RepID=A0A6L2L6A6_TANCI|nr:hypothetical protein [Tanacetum cinerariifolium]
MIRVLWRRGCRLGVAYKSSLSTSLGFWVLAVDRGRPSVLINTSGTTLTSVRHILSGGPFHRVEEAIYYAWRNLSEDGSRGELRSMYVNSQYMHPFIEQSMNVAEPRMTRYMSCLSPPLDVHHVDNSQPIDRIRAVSNPVFYGAMEEVRCIQPYPYPKVERLLPEDLRLYRE